MMSPDEIDAFQRDGVVVVRGVFVDWVDRMVTGVAENMAQPGEYASENAVSEGRFFDDYCNWTRIAAFEDVVRNSPAAALAAAAMQSRTAQFFHDHVLVKEPGTPKPTPWHQDSPYYFVEGKQTVSMWLPLDPVREASLRFIAGSHRWDKLVRPVSWADDSDFYQAEADWTPVPDPDADPDANQIREWAMEPGDAVLFDFRTAHGARGNSSTSRRRALSLRWVGDDARYVARPGRTSPPFPGHDMTQGQRLREDWFPVIWKDA
ncbi:Ectoine hydroxylase-related dioxygenase, phytanoyl-CoA dioxygenase (PhyH) family [Cognatiyoonia koreensis]|uniref:Ectoine hydroxylase-related dioxygenase, phytanoyl-CoA dioxygenase (PhyH) family n=1 Tax=Cognatiyoonia koreensis TaxID=364200 RepID=A0A1I0RFH6_9RHOB|nr:phytanoyl-CoA dioxygenase family protein [Cognatiyoonia koreensis]SEW39661.1 Ectoine hydroxylase-related dioxygenase, phytanoyl-CoA dioxygenase (PhyH) family [Cognatiyoonia koreensis]